MPKAFKAACIICCLCLMVWMVATPAKAAVYNISDFFDYNVVDKETDTRTAYFEVDVPAYSRVFNNDVGTIATGYGSFDWVFPSFEDTYNTFSIYTYHFGGVLYTGSKAYDHVLDVSDIIDGTEVTLSADFEVYYSSIVSGGSTLNFSYRTFVIAYDANMNFIGETKTAWTSATVPSEADRLFEYDISYTLPRNTFYIGLITQTNWTSAYSLGTFHLGVNPRPVTLSVAVDMIYEQSQTMQKIEQQLGDIGGKLDDTNNQLEDVKDKLDGILNQPEQEKSEAQQGANDAFDGVVDVVPDHSEGLVDAFSGLASSMSYNGTAAKLAIPAVSLPGIDGLYDGFIVMQPQELDFEVYFQMLPENLLLLVQSLFTAALIIFCFKELYNTIQYCLTLKGGN